MVTKYQLRVSTYVFTVALAAPTIKGLLIVPWAMAGYPPTLDYIYIQHEGRTVAIDGRLLPAPSLTP
jgi:hypothetical protein